MFKITFSTIYRHDFHKNCRSFKQFTKNNHFFKKEIPKAPTGYLTQPAQPRRRRKPGGNPGSLLLVFCRSFSALRGKCAASTQTKPPAQPLFTDILYGETAGRPVNGWRIYDSALLPCSPVKQLSLIPLQLSSMIVLLFLSLLR